MEPATLGAAAIADKPGDRDSTALTGDPDSKGFHAAGQGTNDLALTPGVAVHLKAGQFVNMNLHVAASSEPVTYLSGVLVQTVSAETVTDEAEMIFGGTFNINLPSDGQSHEAQGGSYAPADYQAFALWPHMHSLGLGMRLTKFHGTQSETALRVWRQ